MKKWVGKCDLVGVEVGLVPEEQDDAGVIHGPRERLGIGVGACRAGLDAGVEEVAVAHDLVRAIPQAALERLDGDEAHEPPRLGGGDLGPGRGRARRGRGEGARVEEERSVGRGATEEEAGGGRAPQGHGAVVVEVWRRSRQRGGACFLGSLVFFSFFLYIKASAF